MNQDKTVVGKKKSQVGINIENPIIKTKHRRLTRATKHSLYRSKCPVCKKGVLLMTRQLRTLELSKYDICILCGQRFEYTDIDILKKNDKISLK